MTFLKITAVAVAAWLGLLGSGYAYLVDWNQPYQAREIGLEETNGTWTEGVYQNKRSYNRMVGAWQSFRLTNQAQLGGIALQLNAIRAGSVDLNVYAGKGVQGELLSTTKLEWDAPFSGWYSFKLNYAVLLVADETYTFALENVTGDDILTIMAASVGTKNLIRQFRYMDQDNVLGSTGPQGYTSSTYALSSCYVLLD